MEMLMLKRTQNPAGTHTRFPSEIGPLESPGQTRFPPSMESMELLRSQELPRLAGSQPILETRKACSSEASLQRMGLTPSIESLELPSSRESLQIAGLLLRMDIPEISSSENLPQYTCFEPRMNVPELSSPQALPQCTNPLLIMELLKVSISTPFPLLSLPVEVRLEIPRHCLPQQVRYSILPKPVDVHYPVAFYALGQERWIKYTPAWAKRKRGIKDLMLVCRQLRNELEYLLYTKHVFSFKCHPSLNNLQQSVGSLSSNAKSMLAQLLVAISLSLPFSETMDKASILGSCYLEVVKQDFTYLRDKLPGMQKVYVDVRLMGGPLAVASRRWIEIVADVIIEMLSVFATTTEVILLNDDRQQCRKVL